MSRCCWAFRCSMQGRITPSDAMHTFNICKELLQQMGLSQPFGRASTFLWFHSLQTQWHYTIQCNRSPIPVLGVTGFAVSRPSKKSQCSSSGIEPGTFSIQSAGSTPTPLQLVIPTSCAQKVAGMYPFKHYMEQSNNISQLIPNEEPDKAKFSCGN